MTASDKIIYMHMTKKKNNTEACKNVLYENINADFCHVFILRTTERQFL